MNRPIVPAPASWRFPVPRVERLANGMDVVLHHRPGQYVISAVVVLDLPLTAEPRQAEGVATLAFRCLDEGTRSHPGTSFSDLLEGHGAELTGEVGHSATSVYLDVPASRFDKALPLLAEALAEPELAATDVERHRALRLAEIEQSLAHPSHRAALAFREALVSPGFRAARPSGGLTETVTGLDDTLVAAFHARHYAPTAATLVLAGDFAGDPLPVAEAAFAGWTGQARRGVHERPEPAPPTALLLDRPGAVQADVRLGAFGIDRTDPRWPDLQMGVHALGGAFLSRLNRVLREERGYTYGVALASQPLRHGGLLGLQGSFRTEVAAAAVAEARLLLGVSAEPLRAAEIADAVNYTIGITPLRYATASGITEQVASLLAAGLPLDFVDGYLDALRRVTPESATATVAELLDPGALTLVVVGDAARIADGLRADGWDLQIRPA